MSRPSRARQATLGLAVAAALLVPVAAAVPATAAGHPVAGVPAARGATATGRPVPPAIARRLLARRPATLAPATPGPAGLRRLPETTASTDLPTRLAVDGSIVVVPFTVQVPTEDLQHPAGIVVLSDADGHLVAGVAGQTTYRGTLAIDQATFTSLGKLVWAAGVIDDSDDADGDSDEVGFLPTTVKLQSLLAERVTRHGNGVTVAGATRTFARLSALDEGDSDDFAPAAGRIVYLQRWTHDGWATVRTLRSDPRGHVGAELTIPSRVGLRLTTRDTATVFGAVTPQSIA